MKLFKDLYYIDKIDYKTAMNIIVDKHYLHRKCSCSFAFGLFQYDDNHLFSELVGVVIYGSPASHNLTKGICGEKYQDQVIELTRLWISDTVPKNGESYLIGNTIPLLNKDIIVSFSEINQGHIGIVYQATNFLYTGLSAKRTDLTSDDILINHNRTLTAKLSSKQIKELYPNSYIKERPRKHRYIYLRGNKWRKKELLNNLKYPILPYPKNN